MLGSSQWMYQSDKGFYDHKINDSLRFKSASSVYLSRTPSSAGSRTTWTVSMWVKRASLGSSQMLFSASTSTVHYATIQSDNTIRWRNSTLDYETTQVFRDTSSWYHLVFKWDTTNGTAANRAEIYVNGEKITQYDVKTNASSSETSTWNNNEIQNIGRYAATGTFYYDGYMADVHFVDGTALDASSFGETKSGIWIPKAYTGSYGTNGFHLKLNGNVNDSSGNGNNWSVSGIGNHDYMLTGPTNNFAVMNPLTKAGSGAVTYYEGNLNMAVADNGNARSDFVMDSGKWYWEAVVAGGPTNATIGIAEDGYYSSNLFNTASTAKGYIYINDGNKRSSLAASAASYGASYTTGDIIGVAYDADNGTVAFYKNNVSQGTAYTGLSGGHSAYFQGYGGTAYWVINTGSDSTFAGNKTAQGNADENGQGDFYYTPPSSFLALCSANLPDPAIDPLNDETPQDYFNIIQWTGNNTNNRALTGVGFQPDLVVAKSRSANSGVNWVDSVRGGTKNIRSTTTAAEQTVNTVISFQSDGFTVGDGNGYDINKSGESIVGWSWKAGTSYTPTITGFTSGSASINTTAGFGIYQLEGTNTSTSSFTHGLDEKPSMIIAKNIDNAYNWAVWHKDFTDTTNKILNLNGSSVEITKTGIWNTIDSTEIEVDSYAETASNGTYIYYVWHDVDGFSRYGSFTGNANNDGCYVYTGFRPAFVAIKSHTGAVQHWHVYDNSRSPTNIVNDTLYFNLTGSEYDFTAMDFLSNGFKFRNSTAAINGSQNYIFMAWAEQPFKYANAR